MMSAVPGDPLHIFAAGYHNLFKSGDGGKTWMAQKGPATDSRVTSLLALAPDVLIAGTDQNLYKGQSSERSKEIVWTAVGPDGGMGGVRSLQRSGNGTLAVLTAHGALVSSDAGGSWQTCVSPAPSSVWYGLALDAETPARKELTALAATSTGLFRSTDGCRSWTSSGHGLKPETIGLVLFHPTRPGIAYASQGGRVYRSTDAGLEWLPLDDQEAELWPSALLVLPSAPERLFALFPRRGIFSKLVEEPLPATAH